MSSLSSSSTANLKSLQLNAVHRMLSLNDDTSSSPNPSSPTSASPYSSTPAGTSHNSWKILIYDKPCRSIISPLLSVSQLRSRGVTLHLLINAERESIPDVPAVYFVEPTRANLSIIAEDCAKRLYSSVHINFVTKLNRNLMEEFGKLITSSNSIDMISSLHDQYLDFVCVERNLFSLSNKKDSYALMNGSGVTDHIMNKYLEEIAYGLLSVVGTHGCVPIIRCPKGGAPEMVARKLNKLISEHPTTSKVNQNRPLLVILDRNMDLITPIAHASTYQALIDDLLTHNSNRVEFLSEQTNDHGRKRMTEKKFDIDADTDPFYSRHKFVPFPEAIESNGAELQDVTEREQSIRSTTVGGGSAGNGANDAVIHEEKNSASDLANAVDSLPKLLEQKKQLEIHTSILQAVMNEVAKRDVPTFFELESSLAAGEYKNDASKAKADVLELVLDIEKGNVEDKIRLVIVFCLATTAPGSDVTEVSTQMADTLNAMGSSPDSTAKPLNKEDREKLEKGLQAINYLKNLRSLQMIPNMSETEKDYSKMGMSTGNTNTDMLSNFMARATNQATGLLAKATERVSTMFSKIHKHRATRIVENLCDMKVNTEDDEYLYLDPKVKGDVDVKALRGMSRSTVKEAITFVIGGGCYAEYQNLQMIANERRTITYGSTELLCPCEFLQQLGKLS